MYKPFVVQGDANVHQIAEELRVGCCVVPTLHIGGAHALLGMSVGHVWVMENP